MIPLLTHNLGCNSIRYRYDNRYFIRGKWHNQLPQISLVYVSLAARHDGCQRGGRGLWSLVIHLKIDPKTYSEIIRDKSISHGAFRVWHFLRDSLGGKDNCWPSRQTICETIGCSKSSLSGWLEELQQGKYIRIQRRSRRTSNKYFLSGIIPNHSTGILLDSSGSKSGHVSGIVSGHELKQIELNKRNGVSPSERISLEKELEALKEERSSIRRNCAQDAFGTRFYDAREKLRLDQLKERIPKLERALIVPI